MHAMKSITSGAAAAARRRVQPLVRRLHRYASPDGFLRLSGARRGRARDGETVSLRRSSRSRRR